MVLVLLLAVAATALGGCGTVNVQASGGGASGFVSLGALMLGSAAVRHARGDNRGVGDDRQAPPPPDTLREPREEAVETDSPQQDNGNSE